VVLRSVSFARNGRATAALVVAASVSAATALGVVATTSLASVTRRTFTPAEVQLIYNELGEP